MKLLTYFHTFLFLLSVVFAIKEVSDSSFYPTLDLNTWSVVLFYSKSCQYCQKFYPIWNYLPLIFPEIQFTQIDGNRYKSITNQFVIKSYPSILIFKGINEVEKFQNSRNLNEISNWIEKLTNHKRKESKPLANYLVAGNPREFFHNNITEYNDNNITQNNYNLWQNILNDYENFESVNYLIFFMGPWQRTWTDPFGESQQLIVNYNTKDWKFGLIDITNSNNSEILKFFQVSTVRSMIRLKVPKKEISIADKLKSCFYSDTITENELINDKHFIWNNLKINLFDKNDVEELYPGDERDLIRKIVSNEYDKKDYTLSEISSSGLDSIVEDLPEEEEEEEEDDDDDEEYWRLREL